MSRSFPKLSEEVHRGIYLAGVKDHQLIDSLDVQRKQMDGAMDLDELIAATQRLAEREASLLSERLEGPSANVDGRRPHDQQRLAALQKLLAHSSAPPQASRALRTPAAAEPYVKTQQPQTQFKTARELNTYAKAPCVLHPKALKPHSNGECLKQQQQLGRLPHGATATALMASARPPTTPHQPQQYSTSFQRSSSSGYSPYPAYPPQPAYSEYGAASAVAPSRYSGSEYGFVASTVRQQRQQANLQHQGVKLQQPPGLQAAQPRSEFPAPSAPPLPQGDQRQPGPMYKVGGLELPPPVKGHNACEYCHWRDNHFPYPCGYQYPWVAGPGFSAPGDNHSPQLHQLFQASSRRMPPGMQLGGLLPDWYERYKDQLSKNTAIPQQHGAMGIPGYQSEYPAMVGYGNLDPALVAYENARNSLGIREPLFINQQPIVVQVTAPPSSSSLGEITTAASALAVAQAPAQNLEYGAAFPRSFLQLPDQSSAVAPAAAPPVVPLAARAAAPVAAPAATPHTGAGTKAASLRKLIRLTTQMQRLVTQADMLIAGAQQGDITAAASATLVASADLEHTQALSQQLQQVMRENGVTPGGNDPTGLYKIQLQNRGGRKYILDTLLNSSPAEGVSILLTDGSLHQPHTIVDSGCSTALGDKGWMDVVKWAYRPTDIKLVLANGTTSRVLGIGEPAYLLVAACTTQEAKVMVQPLVVENARPTFSFALSKDIMHALDAYVVPSEQTFSYTASAGHRAAIPVSSYQQLVMETASGGWLAQDLAYDCTATAMVAVAASAEHSAYDPQASCRHHPHDSHSNSECKLQQGQQGRCKEAQHAAAFAAAGVLASVEDKFCTYSSSFQPDRRATSLAHTLPGSHLTKIPTRVSGVTPVTTGVTQITTGVTHITTGVTGGPGDTKVTSDPRVTTLPGVSAEPTEPGERDYGGGE